MTTIELVKYVIDLAYDHWIITLLFIICGTPWNVIRVGDSRKNSPSESTNEGLNGVAEKHKGGKKMRTIEVYKFEDLNEKVQDNVATLLAKNNGITKEIARSVLEKGYCEFYKDGETVYMV